MALSPGQRIGPYHVLDKIGEGGMGEVYRAHDPRIGRDVAIKVLPASLAGDAERLTRFEREARATGQLNHPNVLTIYDTGTLPTTGDAPGAPFIVAELLEGATLRERLRRGPIETSTAIDYAIQIARGLAAAHAKGIVHRDLKPENLFVTPDGRVKILDFGVAKLAPPVDSDALTQADAAATHLGGVVGTLDYMAPEQARGEAVDRRADLFALGLILREMTTGARPFRGEASAGDPASIPSGADDAVRRCLERSPDRRFQSADDVVRELELVESAARSEAAHPLLAEPQSRGRFGSALIAAALILMALVAWGLFRPERASHGGASAARATPFLAGDEVIEKLPAWSPAGNLIAYVSDGAGNDDIWICDPSCSKPINLTASHAGIDSMPAWRPDGTQLAFFSDREGGGIFTMNALGGDVRRVVAIKPGVLYTFSLTWSRDGSLVYTNFDEGGRKQVFRVAASGAAPACLTCDVPTTDGGRSGELSADGRLLLYKSSEIGARGSVLVRQLASGLVTRVLDQADMPRWSADGTRVLFISSRDGTPDLWQVEVDQASGARTGEAERLTSGIGVGGFTVAPDGRQILVVKQAGQAGLWTFPTDAPRIDDLAQGERWTGEPFIDSRGRWVPGEGGVVFQSNRRGSLDIWTVPSPGAISQRLTDGPGTEHRPRVSPSGQWIAFDVIDEAGEHVHLMRHDGSAVRLPDASWPKRFSMTCCAAWSPDGSRLAMHVNGWTSAIVRIDPGTGAALETVTLDLPGAADEYHRWSPDGRLIAYEAVTEGSWDLWVVKADGSGANRLTSLPGSERSAAWHPRLPFIYFASDDGAIWRVRIDGSGRAAAAPQRWLTPSGRLEAASDSIDFTDSGDRVLVTLLRRASDIWLVELGK